MTVVQYSQCTDWRLHP